MMLISDAIKMGLIINVIWVVVALFLNHKWFRYSLKLNDEWADICETLCSEVEDYYTKGSDNKISMNGQYEWCSDCKEYDKERHCCPRWNSVIRNTVEELYNAKGEE